MNELERRDDHYQSYDYKAIVVESAYCALYLDCYLNFGWSADTHVPMRTVNKRSTVQLRRNRNIINKVELTRLERQFEACIREMEQLEAAKKSRPLVHALMVGLVGTVLLAGATFAVVNNPPIIWLCILLAAPGFAAWAATYFVYRMIEARERLKIQPLIECKHEELFAICEKGHSLL